MKKTEERGGKTHFEGHNFSARSRFWLTPVPHRYLLRNDSEYITYWVTGPAVIFSFSSNRLKKELSDAKAMVRAYGDRAKPLKMRLDLLAQVTSLADVPTGSPTYCHQLSSDRKDQFAVTIKDNWRLIFRSDPNPPPKLPEGGVDFRAIKAITLIEVTDYHGR
jgi:proteic killer suppression protein